ncbi:MAG TPA: hypothetical protein VEN81_01105 [Planctomycetota bacterium]|nr:hypothetical protein [Planctomycetota bacterium]
MDYFWKENKRFVILVGAGFLGLILYNSFVLGPLARAADQARLKLQREKTELKVRMANGVPSEDSLRAARASRDRMKQSLGSLVKDVAFSVPDKFRKPSNESAKTHFESLNIDLYKELHQKAVNAKIAFPANVGLDSVNDENAAEYLLRLAVVEELSRVAIGAEVEKIEILDGLASAGSRDEAPGKKAAYLTKVGAYMKFSGKAEAVFRVLHGVQRKGQYLAVTNFEAQRDDQTKDLFLASITVAMLRVDEKAGLEAK